MYFGIGSVCVMPAINSSINLKGWRRDSCQFRLWPLLLFKSSVYFDGLRNHFGSTSGSTLGELDISIGRKSSLIPSGTRSSAIKESSKPRCNWQGEKIWTPWSGFLGGGQDGYQH